MISVGLARARQRDWTHLSTAFRRIASIATGEVATSTLRTRGGVQSPLAAVISPGDQDELLLRLSSASTCACNVCSLSLRFSQAVLLAHCLDSLTIS